MARYSNDPKEATVKCRINEEMKAHIDKSSKRKGETISEYLRNLILKDMKIS